MQLILFNFRKILHFTKLSQTKMPSTNPALCNNDDKLLIKCQFRTYEKLANTTKLETFDVNLPKSLLLKVFLKPYCLAFFYKTFIFGNLLISFQKLYYCCFLTIQIKRYIQNVLQFKQKN